MRNPNDKTRLVVDEYAAGVVKRIFKMRAEGMGYGKIVEVLNRENIPSPRLYYYIRQNKEPTEKCGKAWQIHVIPRILMNEIYLGHTISLQYTRSYRSGKSKRRNEDEWLKIPDTHESVIDADLWEKAQSVNERLSKWVKNAREPQTYLFSGKIYCNGCNKSLMARSEKREKSEMRRNSYTCRTYHSSGRQLCTRHAVNEDALKKIVLDNIKRHAEHISLDEKQIAAELYKKLVGDISVDKADIQKQLRELKQLLHNLDVKLEQFYEDKVTGVISAATFTMLATKTEAERNGVSEKITLLEKGESETKARLSDIQIWIGLIKENATVDDIDRALVETLIERIEVGESTIENGVKSQEIRIIYKFVGVV